MRMESDLAAAALPVIDAAEAMLLSGDAPVIIAIDGRSGSGKTELSSILAKELDAAIIPGDDFYATDVPDAVWDACTPAERADGAIDWRRPSPRNNYCRSPLSSDCQDYSW